MSCRTAPGIEGPISDNALGRILHGVEGIPAAMRPKHRRKLSPRDPPRLGCTVEIRPEIFLELLVRKAREICVARVVRNVQKIIETREKTRVREVEDPRQEEKTQTAAARFEHSKELAHDTADPIENVGAIETPQKRRIVVVVRGRQQ